MALRLIRTVETARQVITDLEAGRRTCVDKQVIEEGKP